MAKKTIDLGSVGRSFRQVKPPERPAEPPAGSGFDTAPSGSMFVDRGQQLPLNPGAAIAESTLTPGERQQLLDAGWRPGQEIPANLADLLEDEAATNYHASQDVEHLPPPVPEDTPPLRMPDEQAIESLPPEHRGRIAAALQEAQRQREQARRAPQEPGGPGVREAMEAARGTRPLKELQLERTPKQPDAPAPSTTSAQGTVKLCPRCDYPVDDPDPIKLSRLDKQGYLATFLGGAPWQKTFSLYGGSMELTLRSLRPKEHEAIQAYVYERQRAKDPRFTEYIDSAEWAQRYRMCLQIVSVTSAELNYVAPGNLTEWGQANFDEIFEIFCEHLLTSESIYRVVSQTASHFNRMLIKLEANALSPDFSETLEPGT